MKYLNIRLNTSFSIQGNLYNILAQMIHAKIARVRLSSHCNFVRLRVTPRHYQNMLFGNQPKWKIDTSNLKNEQKMFVISKH